MKYTEKLKELETFLKLDPQLYREKISQAFNNIAGTECPKIVLFGAGELGRKIVSGLRKVGLEPIAFADNNSKLQSHSLLGIPVYSPAEAVRRFSQEAVFIITIWRALASESMRQRRNFLIELGCIKVCSVFPLFWKFPNIFLPYYCADEPYKVITSAAEIRAVLHLFADEFSRLVFIDHVLWRIDPERYDLDAASDQTEYFPQDLFSLHDHEIYVDCGGYDGDTTRQFLKLVQGQFSAIYIIEPDPHNFSLINMWRSQLSAEINDRIHVFNVAASNSTGTVTFSANSSFDSRIVSQEGTLQVPCDMLDKLLDKASPTIIKMDIEGAENLALQGAKSLIQSTRPILAICLYHNQADLWKIPAMIQGFSKEYSFFLKAHSLDGISSFMPFLWNELKSYLNRSMTNAALLEFHLSH